MKAVITVIGTDQVGIVHQVSGVLLDYQLNIEDISQTLMDNYFTMIMLVNLEDLQGKYSDLVKSFDELADKLGLSIRVQHEELFQRMHQL